MKKLLFSLAILFILGSYANGVLTPKAGAQEVPRITAEELKDKLDRKADVIVVDARSKDSFERGHIKGAISMPLEDVEERHKELPRDKEIIFYCT